MDARDASETLRRCLDRRQRAEAARLRAEEKRRQAEAARAWAQVLLRDAAEQRRAVRELREALHSRTPQPTARSLPSGQ